MSVRHSVMCGCALFVLVTAASLSAQTRAANASTGAAVSAWTPEKTPGGRPGSAGGLI